MDIVIIVSAIAFGAFVKGATGSGLPVIAIPVMAALLGVERAVVVMAIPAVLSNTWLLWVHRRRLPETRDLPTLLGCGVVGAVVGTWLLRALDPRLLSLVLASVIVGYAAVFVTRPGFRLRPEVTRYLAAPVGAAGGALQGATGISGPLLSTYLHAYRLDRAVYVVSVTTLYLVFAVAQVFSLAALGLYSTTRLQHSLLALLPMAVLPLGNLAARRLSRKAFDYAVLAVLLGAAATMAYDALLGP